MDETFVVGDVKQFTIAPELDGSPWNMTGGTVTLYLRSPSPSPTGTVTSYSATIVSPGTTAQYVTANTVLNVAGEWERWWKVTDANGIQETMPAVSFTVQAVP